MFTVEQLEFAAAIERFCADNCGTAEQRAQLTKGLSNSPELLAQFAELGWLGVSVPAEYGGGGAGMVGSASSWRRPHAARHRSMLTAPG